MGLSGAISSPSFIPNITPAKIPQSACPSRRRSLGSGATSHTLHARHRGIIDQASNPSLSPSQMPMAHTPGSNIHKRERHKRPHPGSRKVRVRRRNAMREARERMAPIRQQMQDARFVATVRILHHLSITCPRSQSTPLSRKSSQCSASSSSSNRYQSLLHRLGPSPETLLEVETHHSPIHNEGQGANSQTTEQVDNNPAVMAHHHYATSRGHQRPAGAIPRRLGRNKESKCDPQSSDRHPLGNHCQTDHRPTSMV